MVAAAVVGGQFTSFSVHDVRFPMSLDRDGSGALHADPDYSKAYVVVHTSTGVDLIDFRHLSDALERPEALDILQGGAAGREDREAHEHFENPARVAGGRYRPRGRRAATPRC